MPILSDDAHGFNKIVSAACYKDFSA